MCHTSNNCSQSHVNLLATVAPPPPLAPALRPTPPGLWTALTRTHVSLKITKNWHMPRSRTRARSIAGGAALPSTKNTQLRLHTPYRCQPALDGSELKGGLFGGWGARGKQLLSSLRALSAAAAAVAAAAQSSSPSFSYSYSCSNSTPTRLGALVSTPFPHHTPPHPPPHPPHLLIALPLSN